MSSFEEGAPDYATLDNPEMLLGAKVEYRDHASAYADSTNVFVPYTRQSGLRYAGEIHKRDGNVDAVLSGVPYEDITAQVWKQNRLNPSNGKGLSHFVCMAYLPLLRCG